MAYDQDARSRTRSRSPTWLYFGVAAALVLLMAAMLVIKRGDSVPIAIKGSEAAVRGSKPSAILQGEPSGGSDPASKRLADAFQAATGHRTAFSVAGDGGIVATRPVGIVQLPFGPALLTAQTIKDACHSCGGAIGIYYLREAGGKIEVAGGWPRAVEGWDWGGPPNEWELTEKFTAYPAIHATGDFMAQGVIVEGATITELRPGGPVTSEMIGTSYSDADNRPEGELACVVKGRIANVSKDRSFEVIVTGSARAVDRYEKRNGRFVARRRIRWDLPCGYSDGAAR